MRKDMGVPASPSGLRPFGVEPPLASQAEPLVPNAFGYIPQDGWRAERRYRCKECHDFFAESEVLKAPNPFAPADEIYGCPHCCEVENLALLCDFPGCSRYSSSGEPTPEGGYVHRCHEHSLWAFGRRDSDVRPQGNNIEGI